MADENKMEFDGTAVVTMADGVEVETIAEGQAMKNEPPELEFIVQEEVETTTDGPHLAEEDPVKNVLLSLQQSAEDGHDRFEIEEADREDEDGGRDLEIRVDDDDDYSPSQGPPKKKQKSSRRKGKKKKSSTKRVAISMRENDSKKSSKKWSRGRTQPIVPGKFTAAARPIFLLYFHFVGNCVN